MVPASSSVFFAASRSPPLRSARSTESISNAGASGAMGPWIISGAWSGVGWGGVGWGGVGVKAKQMG
jgi:hypothetical protein